MTDTYEYPGQELDLFAAATHWKRYWGSRIVPHLRGDVLEVGAGIGTNTPFLVGPAVKRWVCLEPDRGLAGRLASALAGDPRLRMCEPAVGTVSQLPRDRGFDVILYIDVLEHIEDDRAELREAAARLKPGGELIVLAPAHQWLYTPFDRAIGHFRRYSKASLLAAAPAGVRLQSAYYLDSLGLLLSGANRLFLKSSTPTAGQIRFWDGVVVPTSQWTDRLLAHAAGKTVVAIWKAPA
jgi:SAM-dependent methyltransferase